MDLKELRQTKRILYRHKTQKGQIASSFLQKYDDKHIKAKIQ